MQIPTAIRAGVHSEADHWTLGKNLIIKHLKIEFRKNSLPEAKKSVVECKVNFGSSAI